MGMGEPLANYKSVIGAVRRMVAPAPQCFGLSARNITVSTVGLVPAINKLAKEGIPVTLALSLHAPDDALRDEIVPINSRWTVGEALDAARAYFETTGRRVSIRSEEHTSELQSRGHLVCRLLLEKQNKSENHQ